MLRISNRETLESEYKIGKRVGAGPGAGETVYLGTHLGSGEMWAIKNIGLSDSGRNKVRSKQSFLNNRQTHHHTNFKACDSNQNPQFFESGASADADRGYEGADQR